jgi:hypothetical protein
MAHSLARKHGGSGKTAAGDNRGPLKSPQAQAAYLPGLRCTDPLAGGNRAERGIAGEAHQDRVRIRGPREGACRRGRVTPSAGAPSPTLFLRILVLKPLIFVPVYGPNHSEKQRDNSGKTANYQRDLGTMFFHANSLKFLICSHRSRFSRVAGKKVAAPRRGRKGRLAWSWLCFGIQGGLGKKSAKRRGRLRGACRRLSRRS